MGAINEMVKKRLHNAGTAVLKTARKAKKQANKAGPLAGGKQRYARKVNTPSTKSMAKKAGIGGARGAVRPNRYVR